MLDEPRLDPARTAAETALAQALDAVLALDAPAASSPMTPDAEALGLRALLTGGGDPRRAMALKALHGRLTSASGPEVVACGPEARSLAADRHGLPVRQIETPDDALKAAGQGRRAVIDLAARTPWWGRLLARPDLGVVGALPDDRLGLPRALIVSTETSGPTGDDRTFWVTDSTLADPRIVEALAVAGLSAHPLASAGGLKLFVVAGYVQAGDGRLAALPGSLKGVIGAAPVF